jgi:alpha-galactosidase
VKRKQNLQGVEHAAISGLASGIVFNRAVVEKLPADAAVEVPVMADAAGIHQISLGPFAGRCRQAPKHADQRPAACGRSGGARIEGDRFAVAADRSGDQLGDGRFKLLDGLWEVNRLCIRPCV